MMPVDRGVCSVVVYGDPDGMINAFFLICQLNSFN